MTEDKVYNLRELREIFRERMNEIDFCIGEEQVEKLFRELLGEPEPEIIKHEMSDKDRITLEQVNELMKDHFTKHPNALSIFEQDNFLYTKLKKR
jgi:hypothetical protein